MDISKAKEILKHSFGYDSFRLHQQAAIEAVLNKKDVLLLMPTGGGKSLCYQIPAMMSDGLTIVISPLIALMKDQVDALRSNGIAAAFLNSTQSAAEQVEIMRSARSGQLKLLYVAPERLLQSGDQFVEFLRSLNVSLFAIDEAHCVSSWGHDFRPEYRQLARLKKEFPNVPEIALTATADKIVREDIVKNLELQNAEILVSSFNRPNISYRVEPKKNSFERLLKFLEKRKDESGIIYCLSRSSVEDLAEDLREAGYAALPYHAGLDRATRIRNQEAFINDEAKIIVATIAFGMGIDKSNVRFVVHMDLPKNIESYYQETGRAGRDGLSSEALLFFSIADLIKLQRFAQVEGNDEQTLVMMRKLDKMGEYANVKSCRRRFLLAYFSEELNEDCKNCDNCSASHEKFDGTIIAQKALSAVVRTGQRFGINYLVDFLRGSKSNKIWDEHKQLKTYGVGADVSKDEWFAYFKDLIAQGFLTQSDGTYPIVLLTEKSEDVLKGKTKVELFAIPTEDDSEPEAPTPEHNRELFEQLRKKRLEFARNEGLPPYVIFSDASLVEMAAFLPQTPADMKRISGVGDLKMEKYGSAFLEVIAHYCSDKGLDSKIDQKRHPRTQKKRTKRNGSGEDTFGTTYKMFRFGKSVAEISAERGLTISTVEGHLARFIQTGEIELEEIVASHKIEPIRNAILRADAGEAVGPVKQLLGEDYSYGEIKAVAAAFMKDQ